MGIRIIILITGICVTAFSAALLFASPSPAQESLRLYVSQASASQENRGKVLSAFTSASGMNESDASDALASSDPLAALRKIPGTSVFASLLDGTGVTQEMSADGTYTFFVPTNDAFARSSVGPLAYLGAAEKRRLAEYHIVPGRMMSLDSLKFGHMTMLSRDQLDVSVLDVVSVEANTHILGTYRVRNGIVYLIDIVLLPPVQRPFPF